MVKTNHLHWIENVKFNVKKKADATLIEMYSNQIEMLNLAGGIPIDEDYEITLDISFNTATKSLEVENKSLLFENERILFFSEKYIYNHSLWVYRNKKGIGTYILINEIIQARKLGMKYLKTVAIECQTMNGYYTWARLGFTFEYESDKKFFANLLIQNSREEKTITELMQTKEGQEFWLNYGFTWNGIFDVSSESENIVSLNNYLSQAKIKFSL